MSQLICQEAHYETFTAYSRRAIMSYNEEMMAVFMDYTALTDNKGIHQHPHRQLTTIIEGSFIFFIGEEVYHVEKGATLLIEPNVAHGCVPKELPATFCDVFTPMREDFIK